MRRRFTGTADEDVCRGCSIYSYVRSFVVDTESTGSVDGEVEVESMGGEMETEVESMETEEMKSMKTEEMKSMETEEMKPMETEKAEPITTMPMYVDSSAVSTQTPPKPSPLKEDSDMAIQYHFIVNRDNLLVERRALAKRVQQLLTTCRKAVDPNALYSWVQEVNKTLDTLENTLNTSEETENIDDQSKIEMYQELESLLQQMKEEIDACNEKKQYIDLTLFPLGVYWNKQECLQLCHTNTSIFHTTSIQTMEYEFSSKSENYNVL